MPKLWSNFFELSVGLKPSAHHQIKDWINVLQRKLSGSFPGCLVLNNKLATDVWKILVFVVLVDNFYFLFSALVVLLVTFCADCSTVDFCRRSNGCLIAVKSRLWRSVVFALLSVSNMDRWSDPLLKGVNERGMRCLIKGRFRLQ